MGKHLKPGETPEESQNNEMNSQPRPFFILGHPRSGTTALARLLNSSLQLACIYYESNILVHLWKMLNRKEVLQEAVEELLLDFRTAAQYNLQERPTNLNCRKIIFTTPAVDQLTDSFKQALDSLSDIGEIYQYVSRSFFQIFANTAGIAVVGDKVPDYTYIPDVITLPHSSCKLIAIHRDPRAIVHSALFFNREVLHLFASPNPFAMALSIALRERGLCEFYKGFPEERLLRIEQQELHSSPSGVAEKTLSFLGMPGMDNDVVWFLKKSEEKPYRIKNWCTDMSAEAREAVEVVFDVFNLFENSKYRKGHCNASALLEMAKCLKALSEAPEKDLPLLCRDLPNNVRTAEHRETLGCSLIKIGDYYYMKARFARARSFFEAALGFSPHDPILWFKYGVLCFDMKLLDTAMDAFQETEANCAQTRYYQHLRTKAFYMRGRVAQLSADKSQAIGFYRHAIKISPDFRLAQRMLAFLDA